MAETGRNKPRPPMSKTKVRIQVVLEQDTLDKVDKYAKKYNLSRSYFCALAIQDNVTNDAYIHDLAFSRLMSPIRAFCKKLYGSRNKKRREEYMKALNFMIQENLEELTENQLKEEDEK